MKDNIVNKRGKLIIFEGIDGSGKTSIIERLDLHFKECLKNINISCISAPSSNARVELQNILTNATNECKTVDNETLIKLFSEDINQMTFGENGIISKLDKGINVIVDRFYMSMFAYQLDIPLILKYNKDVMDAIAPDLTLVICVEINKILKRLAERDKQDMSNLEQFESSTFLRMTDKKYMAAVKLLSYRDNIVFINGNFEKDVVFKEVIKKIYKLMGITI